MEKQFEILKSKREDFVIEINRLNRKAEKYNLQPIEFIEGEPERKYREITVIEEGFESSHTEMIDVIPVTINYQPIIIEGWELLYKLIWDDESSTNIVISYNGHEFPIGYLHRNECDHCMTNRRRNSSYLISRNGNIKQVGSTCIADYLGIDASVAVSRFKFADELIKFVDDVDDYFGWNVGGTRTDTMPVNTAIGYSIIAIDRHGFTPAGCYGYYADERYPTKDEVYDMYRPANESERVNYKIDSNIVQAVKDWVNAQDETESDYILNLKNLIKSERVAMRYLGFVVSAYSGYKRWKFNEELKAIQSEHVGELKDKIEVTGKVIKHIGFTNIYGDHSLLIILGDDGNVYKWASSKPQAIGVEDRITLKGTIKEHAEYNGVKQTGLTRCKIKGGK